MDRNRKIKFNILAICLIVLFAFAISPVTMQNDTYYTIKIGEQIIQNGIDMRGPFFLAWEFAIYISALVIWCNNILNI